MTVRVNNEARKAANARYKEKHYKQISIKLRIDDDADLIESFQKAQASGITSREWLRTLNK